MWYSFYIILKHLSKSKEAEFTIEEWNKQQAIQKERNADLLTLGFPFLSK